jgi:hypothetical protein
VIQFAIQGVSTWNQQVERLSLLAWLEQYLFDRHMKPIWISKRKFAKIPSLHVIFVTVITSHIAASGRNSETKFHWKCRLWILNIQETEPGGTCSDVTYRQRATVAQLVETLCYKLEGRGFYPRWCHSPSDLTVALGSTQPLTEMITRKVKAAGA